MSVTKLYVSILVCINSVQYDDYFIIQQLETLNIIQSFAISLCILNTSSLLRTCKIQNAYCLFFQRLSIFILLHAYLAHQLITFSPHINNIFYQKKLLTCDAFTTIYTHVSFINKYCIKSSWPLQKAFSRRLLLG